MLGTKINNRYHLEQELFATARGTLYLATDDSTGEMLAVKIIPGASLESGTGLRYAHLLKRLEGADHPNLLLPLETGAAPGVVYQVLPYYPGQSLEEVLNQGPLPPEEALLVLQQVAQALGRLHGKGVYHHGVRPANILLSREEGVIQAVLTDPGRSLLYGADTDGPQEAMYRAPEQTPWLESAADGRADFYALGMIAYPLLAGRLPFTGTDARSIHHQHLGSSPPDLRNLNSGLPPRIAEIVARLTARQPRERPPNAFAVLSELESWARPAGGSSAGQGAPGEPAAYIGGFMSPGRALVGRQTARQAIQAALDDASAGRGTMVVLNGPAGMGRRRLLEEMASSWESARALVLRGDSTMGAFNPPYALPLSLLESLVRRWAHIGASRREELADRLRAGVGNDGVVLKSILPALGPMVSSLGEQPPVPMERQRHRYMNLLCSVLLAPGEKGAPVVLWLNGASGADADSVDWLRLLAHRMKNRPALVVVDHSPPLPATGGEALAVPGDDQETDGPAAHGQTAASGGAGSAGRFQRWLDSMPRGDQVRWVELPGLNESQTRLMISDCLGLPWEAGSRPGGAGVTETGLSGQLAAWLGGAHGGHPLALETGLRILAARGWLRRAAPDEPGPPWRFDQEQARSAPWPDSLRALLNLRVELLPRDVLQTLQAAAVLHSTFTVERLQPLLEQHPPLLLLELLECAVEEGLLARGGGGFRFAHPLLHQAVLGTVTGAQRQRLHILAARTMDRGGPVPPLRMHHQTALHFLAAGDNDSLLDQGLTAARAAGSVQALHALAFWMDALGPLLSNDPRRLPLLLAGSTAQAMLGRYERAGRILDSLDSADLEPGDELEVLRLSAWVARRSGRPAEALELVKEALERGGEPLPRSAAGGVLARLVTTARRRYENLRAHTGADEQPPLPPALERIAGALELASLLTATGDPSLSVMADERLLGMTAPFQPTPVLTRALIRLAEKEGDPEGLALREARALLNRNRFPFEEALWNIALGRCQRESLALDKSDEALETARELFRGLGDLRGEAETALEMFQNALLRGSVASMDELAREMLDMARLLESRELALWAQGAFAAAQALTENISLPEAGRRIRGAARAAAARGDGPAARFILALNGMLALGAGELSELMGCLAMEGDLPGGGESTGAVFLRTVLAEGHMVQAAAFPDDAGHHLKRVRDMFATGRGEPEPPPWVQTFQRRLEIMEELLPGQGSADDPPSRQALEAESALLEEQGLLLERGRLFQCIAAGMRKLAVDGWEEWLERAHTVFDTLGAHLFARAAFDLSEKLLETKSRRLPGLDSMGGAMGGAMGAAGLAAGDSSEGSTGFLALLEHMGRDGALPLQALYGQVLSGFTRHAGAGYAALFIPNQDGQPALAAQAPDPPPRGDWINRWLVEECFKERQIRFRLPGPPSPEKAASATGEESRALACIPLLEQGQPIAVVSLGLEGEARERAQSRQAALEELGREAAAVLTLNQALSRRDREGDELRTLAERRGYLLEWSRHASASTTLGGLLQAYHEEACRELAPGSSVLFALGEGDALVPVAVYRAGEGRTLDSSVAGSLPRPVRNQGQAAWAVSSQSPVGWRQNGAPEPTPTEQSLLNTLEMQDGLWLPLVHLGETAGLLLLGFREPPNGLDDRGRDDLYQPLRLITGAILRAMEDMDRATSSDAEHRRMEKLEQENARLKRFLPQTLSAEADFDSGGDNETITNLLRNGRERTLPALCGALAGINPLFELSPSEQLHNLQEYFTRLEQGLGLHHGRLHGLFNDQWSALFQRGAESSLWGAQTVFQLLESYREDQTAFGRPVVTTGLGLHLGDVLLGAVPAGEKLSPLLAGQGVRSASRLAQMCLDFRCGILVSETVLEALDLQTAFDLRPLGRLRLAPGEERIGVFDLFSVRDEATVEVMRRMRQVWDEALHNQQHGHWKDAIAGYREYLEALPDDRPARQFLRACRLRTEQTAAARRSADPGISRGGNPSRPADADRGEPEADTPGVS